jgi:acyl-CoA reductase-like NAD-dependent aldehyde dehydrogenase
MNPPEPHTWQNASPGDLDTLLEPVTTTDLETAVGQSVKAFAQWRGTSLEERIGALTVCREKLKGSEDELARLIALEMGKPLTEARLEVAAVLGKFDFAFADAREVIADRPVNDGPHPALIRHRGRGPAAVIAPFNFPIHLGHGAAVAYLLAGNTVLFKPSPVTAHVGAVYAALMQEALPEGVFELVQGWGSIGRALCVHPAVRSVCFTGSVPVGTALAKELAGDYSKSLALELGGRNALIIWEDADLAEAAKAAADGLCLTTGQRCNASTRILVHSAIEEEFQELLLESLKRYQPGCPLDLNTTLGPLATQAAYERYKKLIGTSGEWLLAGEVLPECCGHRGYFVRPAVLKTKSPSPFGVEEVFAPIATVESFRTVEEAVALQGTTPYGLTASVFTTSEEIFRRLGEQLDVGNLYQNLPTTFSPSALPFGGLRNSGNGKPGGRGFIRFAADEQSVQWRKLSA